MTRFRLLALACGLVAAMVVPAEPAVANHQLPHGPTQVNTVGGVTIAGAPLPVTCSAAQPPVVPVGQSTSLVPTTATLTVTGFATSTCTGLNVSGSTLSLELYVASDPVGGCGDSCYTLLRAASRTCTSAQLTTGCSLSIPNTSVSVPRGHRLVLLSIHVFTLSTGSWSATDAPLYCGFPVAGTANCAAWSDTIV